MLSCIFAEFADVSLIFLKKYPPSPPPPCELFYRGHYTILANQSLISVEIKRILSHLQSKIGHWEVENILSEKCLFTTPLYV